MPIVANDAWRADGIDLMDYRHWIESVDNRETVNGKRQPTWNVPFRQGTPPIWDAPFQAKRISLNMAISGRNASGGITFAGGEAAHLRDNLDRMIQLWSKRDGTPIALERDVPAVPGPGVVTRSAEVTVVQALPITGPNGQFLRRMTVRLLMPWPFWTGGPVTIPAMSPVTVEVSGTAPTWPVINFIEDGRVELVNSPHWIEAPAGTVVDCRHKTITPQVPIRVGSGDWMRLEPGPNYMDGPRFDVTVSPQWH